MTQDQMVMEALRVAQEKIMEALEEAEEALGQLYECGDRMCGIQSRAKAYWLPGIRSLVGRTPDRDFTGNPYDTSIGSTILEIQEAR